jgi:hypothetical protein
MDRRRSKGLVGLVNQPNWNGRVPTAQDRGSGSWAVTATNHVQNVNRRAGGSIHGHRINKNLNKSDNMKRNGAERFDDRESHDGPTGRNKVSHLRPASRSNFRRAGSGL